MFDMNTVFFLLIGCISLIDAQKGNDTFIHLKLRSPVWVDDSTRETYAGSINPIYKDKDDNQYYPFAKRNFTFYAKGTATMVVHIAMYPIADSMPNYELSITDYLMVNKNNNVILFNSTSTGFNDKTYTRFDLAFTLGSNGKSDRLILRNPAANYEVMLDTEWEFDLPYIGFGSRYSFQTGVDDELDIMFNAYQVIKNTPNPSDDTYNYDD